MERRWYFTIGNIWRSTSTWPFTTFGIQFNSSILAQHPQSVTWWRYLFPPHFHHNGYLGLSEKSKSALLLWFVNDLRKQSHYIIMYYVYALNPEWSWYGKRGYMTSYFLSNIIHVRKKKLRMIREFKKRVLRMEGKGLVLNYKGKKEKGHYIVINWIWKGGKLHQSVAKVVASFLIILWNKVYCFHFCIPLSHFQCFHLKSLDFPLPNLVFYLIASLQLNYSTKCPLIL